MTQIEVHKSVAYTVEQPDPVISAHKSVAYVVEQVINKLEVHKSVAYAVEEFDSSGNARQFDNDDRPIYQSGPVPFVDFTGNKALSVKFPLAAQEVTYFTLKEDESFSEAAGSWVFGGNSLPSENFNQLVVLKGKPFRIIIDALRVNMKARV
jgi:hypothetical protein